MNEVNHELVNAEEQWLLRKSTFFPSREILETKEELKIEALFIYIKLNVKGQKSEL